MTQAVDDALGKISWGESVDRGTVVLLVAICGVIVGTGAGVTVKWTRGHVRRVSNGALHAEPAVTACALAVAGFLILVERGLLRESAGSVAVLMAAPPLAAAVAAHSSWPDSALTVAVLVAAAAAVVTVLLGF